MNGLEEEEVEEEEDNTVAEENGYGETSVEERCLFGDLTRKFGALYVLVGYHG